MTGQYTRISDVGVKGYYPLYVDGKRDKALRFVNRQGDVISYRRKIKLAEGLSPEEKAYRRWKEGKAPKGVTATKYERRLKRQRKKPQEDIIGGGPTRPPKKEQWGWKEVPTEPRGYYQLRGQYVIRHAQTGKTATRTGFSTASATKKYGDDFLILRGQAIDHAMAQMQSYEWLLVGIKEEVWLKW